MKDLMIYITFAFLFNACYTSQDNKQQATVDTINSQQSAIIEPGQNDTATERTDLTGSWLLKDMPGQERNWNKTPLLTLDVEEGTFTGNTGCNGMNGRFLVEGEKIKFDNQIVTTKMACIGSYNEQVFLENLLRVNNYSITDTTLKLRQLDTVKMIFKRRPI